MRRMPFLEIACFNADSALIASNSNASRIELCANPSVGGTTPSLETFKSLKNHRAVNIPIYVMIRPHGQGFAYTDAEIQSMKGDIEIFTSAGADGFVFGILTPGGKVDQENCKILLRAAEGRECTFHRAFDAISQGRMGEELEVLINLGFANVLTSGGGSNAVNGRDVLTFLVERARERINVIVGGEIRSANLESLRETGASWFHSSAIINGEEIADAQEIQALSELCEMNS